MSAASVAVASRQGGRTLARVGALWGLVAASVLAVRLVWIHALPPESDPLGGVAWGAAYVAPFALSLWALRFVDPRPQVAVWVGAGILAFPLSFTSLAGVSLVFLPTAALLLAGAWSRHRATRCRPTARWVFLSLILVMAGILSFAALFLGVDRACWELHRTNGGTQWRRIPVTTVLSVGGPVIESRCDDVVSTQGALASLGVWAATGSLVGRVGAGGVRP